MYPDAAGGSPCLYFNPRGSLNHPGVRGLEEFQSPLSFLARTVETRPAQILLAMDWRGERELTSLFDLAAALRRRPELAATPLVCILRDIHRGVLAGLARAAVEWVGLVVGPAFSPLPFLAGEEGLPPTCRPLEGVLAEVCPCLNHAAAGAGKEMAVCGGYGNRLVLGALRRRHFCHGPAHRQCPFFTGPSPVAPGAAF
ncbi:MAG: hypothetical protein KQJ78_08400 [Deltaproteobacteria bacterium]|nr:hypothetical protein [Deltaproteobacteria bacterium]